MIKRFITLCVFLLIASVAHAHPRGGATSGTITLEGVISGSHSLSCNTYAAASSFTDIGSDVSPKIVGKVFLDSNVLSGFKLTISSTNSGAFLLNGGNSSNNSHSVGYTLGLINRTGNISRGIAEPAGLASMRLDAPKTFDFTGNDLDSTSVGYALKITPDSKSTLVPGTFSETLIFVISDI